jgi:hypothetical protein
LDRQASLPGVTGAPPPVGDWSAEAQMRSELLKRIVVDPNVCFGKATILGT